MSGHKESSPFAAGSRELTSTQRATPAKPVAELVGKDAWAMEMQRNIGNRAFGALLKARAGPQFGEVERSRDASAGPSPIELKEIVRVSAKLRADQRIEHIPTFAQSEGEINEKTRNAAQIAYDYRMLVWRYEALLKDRWLVQDSAALAAFAAEDDARSQVLGYEETLEQILSDKRLFELDAYQQDKLRALDKWLAELETALKAIGVTLGVAERLWVSDAAAVGSVRIESDNLSRQVDKLRRSTGQEITSADEQPDMGEVVINAIVLAPFEVLFPFFMTDPEHAAEIERLRQRLRPFAYRSPKQHEMGGFVEGVYNMLVSVVAMEALNSLRAVRGAQGLSPVGTTAEPTADAARLRGLFAHSAELDAALGEIDRISDDLLRYAKTTNPQDAAAIGARVGRGRDVATTLRSELAEYRATRGEQAALALNTQLIGPGDDLARAASWIKSIPGVHDVLVHGSAESFWLLSNRNWIKVSHRSLAYLIARTGHSGEPIRLISCGTGGGGSFRPIAQELANKLGVEVRAPSGTIWIHRNGALTIGASPSVNTGAWETFTPGPRWNWL